MEYFYTFVFLLWALNSNSYLSVCRRAIKLLHSSSYYKLIFSAAVHSANMLILVSLHECAKWYSILIYYNRH